MYTRALISAGVFIGDSEKRIIHNTNNIMIYLCRLRFERIPVYVSAFNNNNNISRRKMYRALIYKYNNDIYLKKNNIIILKQKRDIVTTLTAGGGCRVLEN